MRLQRWAQLEALGITREIPEAEKAPFAAPFLRRRSSLRLMWKGVRSQPFVVFYLDTARPSIRLEAGNVEAGTIAIFL